MIVMLFLVWLQLNKVVGCTHMKDGNLLCIRYFNFVTTKFLACYKTTKEYYFHEGQDSVPFLSIFVLKCLYFASNLYSVLTKGTFNHTCISVNQWYLFF